MTLLFTGASGFLGSNIIQLLNGAYNIISVGLSPQDTYLVDIATDIPTFIDAFDVVFHAAGKAHSVPKTEAEKRLFFDVNLQGTKNLCTALERSGIPKAFIFISTVAVYGCDSGENITEEHPLNGTTPYALSKIKAEKYLEGWCAMHNVKLSILRPSLIAGPNPPGNLGAMIRGIRNGKYLSIAGGKARKSVLMVQDIANLLPMLIEKGGIYNVCDSYQPSFRELEMVICKQLNKKKTNIYSLLFAKSMAVFGDCLGENTPINSLKLRKITHSLTFSNEKAMRELGWKPMNVLENFQIE